MLFNILKCEHLTISNKRSPLNSEYKTDNAVLNKVTSAKYLGVIILRTSHGKSTSLELPTKPTQLVGFYNTTYDNALLM